MRSSEPESSHLYILSTFSLTLWAVNPLCRNASACRDADTGMSHHRAVNEPDSAESSRACVQEPEFCGLNRCHPSSGAAFTPLKGNGVSEKVEFSNWLQSELPGADVFINYAGFQFGSILDLE